MPTGVFSTHSITAIFLPTHGCLYIYPSRNAMLTKAFYSRHRTSLFFVWPVYLFLCFLCCLIFCSSHSTVCSWVIRPLPFAHFPHDNSVLSFWSDVTFSIKSSLSLFRITNSPQHLVVLDLHPPHVHLQDCYHLTQYVTKANTLFQLSSDELIEKFLAHSK